MANHKRRRPKHQRAGCLLCKPHKDERGKNSQVSQTVQAKRTPVREIFQEIKDAKEGWIEDRHSYDDGGYDRDTQCYCGCSEGLCYC